MEDQVNTEITEQNKILNENAISLSKKKKEKKEENRSAQTMLKSMMTNLVRLSEMADQKASLMISVNSIIVSIIVSFLFNNQHVDKTLIVPIAILIFVCMTAIIFAIFATKPNLRLFTTNPNPVKAIDLLFFNSYANLSNDDYKDKMKALIKNEEELMDEVLDNIYSQGKVLQKKYKRINIAFSIFLYGFSFSIFYFLVTFLNR